MFFLFLFDLYQIVRADMMSRLVQLPATGSGGSPAGCAEGQLVDGHRGAGRFSSPRHCWTARGSAGTERKDKRERGLSRQQVKKGRRQRRPASIYAAEPCVYVYVCVYIDTR